MQRLLLLLFVLFGIGITNTPVFAASSEMWLDVVSVSPSYRTKITYQPNCWYEDVAVSTGGGNKSVIGPALGGVTGGILGNQVGKGSGKTAATIAGAAIGAIVGDRLSGDSGGGYVETRQVKRCGQPIRAEELVQNGYDVTIRFPDGSTMTYHTYRQPSGNQIRARVTVIPLE